MCVSVCVCVCACMRACVSPAVVYEVLGQDRDVQVLPERKTTHT